FVARIINRVEQPVLGLLILCYIVVRARLQQLHGGTYLLLGGDDNDINVGVVAPDLAQHLFSGHIGQRIIQGDYGRVLVQVGEAFLAGCKELRLIVGIKPEYVFQEFSVGGVVFNNKNLYGI